MHFKAADRLYTIAPILHAYQGNFQKYVDLLDDKKKLKAMLDEFMAKTTELGSKQQKLMEELEKIEAEDEKAVAAVAPKIKASPVIRKQT